MYAMITSLVSMDSFIMRLLKLPTLLVYVILYNALERETNTALKAGERKTKNKRINLDLIIIKQTE